MRQAPNSVRINICDRYDLDIREPAENIDVKPALKPATDDPHSHDTPPDLENTRQVHPAAGTIIAVMGAVLSVVGDAPTAAGLHALVRFGGGPVPSCQVPIQASMGMSLPP